MNIMTEKKERSRGFYEALVDTVKGYDGRRKRSIHLAPTFFKLLTDLLEDKKTPLEARSLISSAIAYFVTPRDIIPEEVFGPLALIDDVFVCLHVSKKLIDAGNGELLRSHWEGDEPLDGLVAELYPLAENYVGHTKEKILNYVGLSS